MLILGQHHLERVLRQYADHFRQQRPHREIDLQVPAGGTAGTPTLPHVQWYDILGGLIHEYYPVAA
jgi:hypothetical protein